MSVVNTVNAPANVSNQSASEQIHEQKIATTQKDAGIESSEKLPVNEQLKRIEETNKSRNGEQEQSATITPKQLEKVAQQLQDFIGEMNRSLEFSVDTDSGRDVIKVLDKSTGELVKQYPSEEVLSLISKLSDATGNLIDTKI